ncbi:MAG: alpha/beta hydrolase, partial [Alphaproteobacteria bacterium]|nr:alpha/beta hydrolase [Alphaproteobacteria bacterium]
MDKSEHYVREDVRGFLDMLEQMGGKGVEEVGAVDGRQQMRAMKAVAEADNRALAVHRDLTCPGPEGDIPLRLYDTKESREAGPCVVFIHGGGFVIGDIEVYDSLCSEIAHQLDLPVVSVEYRLAPEHPFPAAPDDCEAAARWIASSPAELGREVTGLVISGDSAGGNLTIVTTNQLVNEPAAVPVLVQAPIYPVASDITEHSS